MPRAALATGAIDSLPSICARLAAARAERPQPWVNDEILLEEQGMALCALHRLQQWSEIKGLTANADTWLASRRRETAKRLHRPQR